MIRLEWAIKESLLRYVRGMPDGVVACTDGARAGDAGFVFPAAAGLGEWRFTGSVTLTGHSGMLHLTFRDPHISRAAEGWTLAIADPDDPEGRLSFARIVRFDEHPDGSWTAHGTTLTQAGADLFVGPYVEGTALDDPVIRPA